MNIQQDFEELLRLLEEDNVKYMIVGGYAVAYHGFPRLTQDIDFFYDKSESNAKKIIKCLVDFGFPQTDLNVDTFTTIGNIITFGSEPVRVDFINKISGIDFDRAWKNRVRGQYGKVEVNFISRNDLIKNKQSSNRPKDNIDSEELSK